MKICLINNLYKPYNRGGAERIVELMAKGLRNSGHDVFVISTKPLFKKTNTKNQTPKIYYLNSLYYNLNIIPKILRLGWHLIDAFDIYKYFRVKSILKKEKPDIVMTHNLKGLGFLIQRAIKNLSIKHVHTLHDIQLIHPSGLLICGREKIIDNFLSRFYANICRKLFKSPEIIISPSSWLLNLHVNKKFFNNSKKYTIPNPIDLNKIPKEIQHEKKAKLKIRFLYVGQIEAHKGILFLIKTFKLLCDDLLGADCKLAIIGHGSKLNKAKKLAAKNKSIIFKGKLNENEVYREMNFASALIVPSICYENNPTVIYEAAALGLPVIASRLGGTKELIHNLGGLLFEPKNEGDLMYQMKWLLEHPEEIKKISQKEKSQIKNFSLANYIDKLLKIIN